MKKVIFENCSRAFLATFCFLLLGAIGVSAQSKLTSVVAVVPGVDNPPAPSSPLYNVPQGNFVDAAAATAKLDAKLVGLKDAMAPFLPNTQGDPIFNALFVEYKFYGRIKQSIDAGATTAAAIASGLWIFLESAELGSIPASTQQDLKDQAIALLII